ncbi:hypothetical protein P0D84_38120 [Paraburkholderia sp. RL17-337-BIB-A]|uniref:hypothetical protein n=1 Tax=Paraburkholderia sp. RL17-337-BIB-A TaxID=3031636 RepID=UPI0038B80865
MSRDTASTFADMVDKDRALGVTEHRDFRDLTARTPCIGRGVRGGTLVVDLMLDSLGDTLIEAVGQQHKHLRLRKSIEATDEKKARSGQGASFVKSG